MTILDAGVPTRTSTGHSKSALDAARMAEFVYAPKSDQAHKFVQWLTEQTLQHESLKMVRKRARQERAIHSFRDAIGAFVGDLIHHSGNQSAEGFMYRSSEKDALGMTLVSVRSFQQLSEFWPEMGLMEVTSFFRAKDTWGEHELGAYLGRTRRYRATQRLLDSAEGFGIFATNVKEHFEKQVGRLAVVMVRGERASRNGKKSQPVTIKKKGPDFEVEVGRVSEINSYLATSGFDLSDTPWVYRVYSRGELKDFKFNHGGRLYCRSEDNWQQMSARDRSKITWRGEPTVEIDVRSSHMFILYALHRQYVVPNGDHYSIPDVEREVVKGLITAFLGKGGAPNRWPKEMAARYFERTGVKLGQAYKLSKVLAAIESKHPVLSEVQPVRMDWGKLQFIESECFVEALLELGRSYGIAALPVHDSLIVAKRYAEIAIRVLDNAFEHRFGMAPEIRMTQSTSLGI